VIPAPAPPHTLEDAVVREVHARSADGTTVSVTLIHLPGLEAQGPARVLLYGYGSYGLSQLPSYSSQIAAWVRLGGVYAVATIRGGSEYGRDWHEGGRRALKPNSVSDFIAAAEHLVASGLTEPRMLGIHGASSGGRLVLGAMVRRPELFGAVAAGVPLVDMLRFHHHTFGIAWKQEYGDPELADDFRALLALSPLHNVKPGTAYPPLLILTADNDQRVVPSHAYKMAATVRRLSPQSEVLVRTRRGAGHGSSNSLSKAIEFQADVITFLASRLGGPVRDFPSL
jgi:prolyl oligopeptidase